MIDCDYDYGWENEIKIRHILTQYDAKNVHEVRAKPG